MAARKSRRQSKRRTGQRSTWDQCDQKTTRVSLLGTMDWLLLIVSFGFIVISALLISNGTCSHSRGLSASAPVCIGGHLSVQSWLAIVGVESAALGVILPRVSRLLVSKYLTNRLVYHGLGLAKILNSQTTAPLKTQLVHGSNTVFMLRIPFVIAAVAFSILYKWSFVKVSRYDTFPLSNTNSPIPLGYDSTGHITTLSNNLIDALDPSNPHSSLLSTNLSISGNSSNPQYAKVFGPSLNPITLSAPSNQVSTGTLAYCTPSFYSKNKITASSATWTPPMLTTDSNGDGLRITNTDGALIDISSSNGTITIMAGIFGQPNTTPHYTSYLSANVSVCYGYVSWSINNILSPSSSALSTTPLLQTPIDITCVPEPFDLDTWMASPKTEFILGLLQGLNWKYDDLARKAMDILLASIDHTSSITRLNNTSSPPPNAIPPNNSTTPLTTPTFDPSSSTSTSTNPSPHTLCLSSIKSSTTSPNNNLTTSPPQFILSASLTLHGTGQTLLGTVLQILITLFSLLTVALLLTPGLPLVTEWSAQWLGLVYGLSPPRVQECVEGTSAGGNFAVGAGEEIEFRGAGNGNVKGNGDGSGSRGSGSGSGKGVTIIGEEGVVVEGNGNGDGDGDGDGAGERRRREDLAVFLGSSGGEGLEGRPYLALGLEKGRVRRGWGHV